MSASRTVPATARTYGRRQRGSTAVEFGLLVTVFLVFVFGIIELARAMFLFNTMYDATRRAASAAATTNFGSAANLAAVRQMAIYRTDPGGLILMPTLKDTAVRIDFLSISRASDGTLSRQPIGPGAMPASPAENRRNCLLDPYAGNCAQLVRVRICDPNNANDCDPVQFRPMTSLIPLSLSLPMATTIARTQSLGATVN
jgi:TadE-like protein